MVFVLGSAGYGYWSDWMPANRWIPTDDGGARVDWKADTRSRGNWLAAFAHLQYYADGRRPRYAGLAAPAGGGRYLPVAAIEQAVRAVRPRDAMPVVLSYDEQLYGFLPWKGYVGVDRNASYGPVRWEDRHRELIELSRIADPGAFARGSARTAFGPIDVFVLRRQGDDLTWKGLRVPNTVHFRRSQFAPADFAVTDLTGDTTVAVRR